MPCCRMKDHFGGDPRSRARGAEYSAVAGVFLVTHAGPEQRLDPAAYRRTAAGGL